MDARLSTEQVSAYLARLGYYGMPEPDRNTLDDLIFAHQCSIPFETIDIFRCPTPPVIEIGTVFDKLITSRRGGYCFELNFLFEALLSTLGFDVQPCLCRAVRGRDGRMPINHRGIIVALDGEDYFADVGFGGPLAPGSLMLEDGMSQAVRGETYITKRLGGCWWAIDRITQAKRDLYGDDFPSRRQTELELCIAEVDHIDFEALNLSCCQPGMLFHDVKMANIRTDHGFIGLRDNILTIRNGKESKRIELSDEASFAHALKTYFGFSPEWESKAEALAPALN